MRIRRNWMIWFFIFLVSGGVAFGGSEKSAEKEKEMEKKKETETRAEEKSQRFLDRKNMNALLNDFFADEFFEHHFDHHFDNFEDPFKEMQRMRQRFRKFFDQTDRQRFGHAWENGNFDSFPDQIVQREDEKYIYFDIDTKNMSKDSLEVKVENKTIMISGKQQIEKIEKREGESEGRMMMNSSFQRSFPVPEGVDESKVEIITQKDKIVVKFPKAVI